MFSKQMLEILACPNCKGMLQCNRSQTQLICLFDRLAFPIENGTPILWITRAKQLHIDEIETCIKS